ncbi:maleylpyruvate isomerase family mycothiol-dependent enzyme [Aeromicrobium sp. UC242_57]|uniref:maleylpyruvate isomerase family mycothiol-dependent enzyme n=1 Tax=Aeromicrobium sp. UC242_57 TaxID=3374624 RepID=UPI0037976A72
MQRTEGWQPPDLTGTTLVVQPHCHQSSILGFEADMAIMTATGASIDRLSGCCGLAGNFGVEQGHYEVSVAVAERRAVPAIRNAPAGAVVVADGFSCRTQLDDLADLSALHLASSWTSRRRTPPDGPRARGWRSRRRASPSCVRLGTGDEPVPACPGWTVRDLAEHLGGVHRWAAAIVLSGQRLAPPRPLVEDPVDRWYAGTAQALLAALRAVSPAEEVPNFTRMGETAAFWPRRQMHQTLVHAVDAAQALGRDEADWTVAPAIAADGIDEVLQVFFPRMTARGTRPTWAPASGCRRPTSTSRGSSDRAAVTPGRLSSCTPRCRPMRRRPARPASSTSHCGIASTSSGSTSTGVTRRPCSRAPRRPEQSTAV